MQYETFQNALWILTFGTFIDLHDQTIIQLNIKNIKVHKVYFTHIKRNNFPTCSNQDGSEFSICLNFLYN